MGSLRVEAANPSGWSYASALRSANLNPFQYRILKDAKMLDPNHVLAEKFPLRLKGEDFDEQGELHLELVRVESLDGCTGPGSMKLTNEQTAAELQALQNAVHEAGPLTP